MCPLCLIYLIWRIRPVHRADTQDASVTQDASGNRNTYYVNAQKFSFPALFEGASLSDPLQRSRFNPAPPKFSFPAVFQGGKPGRSIAVQSFYPGRDHRRMLRTQLPQ